LLRGVGSRDSPRQGDVYPSDLKDAEWARLQPLILEASPGGRPRKTDMRGGDGRHSVFAAIWAAAYGVTRSRGQSLGCDSRQSIGQIS
jgi:hypothetical protein